jgi:ketosteroid isomerase-like protein
MNTKLTLAVLVAVALHFASIAGACELSAEKVGETIGVKATTTPDGVVRVGWPRTDVKVNVDGTAVRPFAGLGSWAAFQKTEHGAMLMGDTVVFQDEVNSAIDAAFTNGIEVTGLHNHFFFDEPKVYFMHIGGEGCPDKLAQGVRAVWDAIKKVRSANQEPVRRFDDKVAVRGSLDADKLASIIGTKGATEDGIVKITIGRQAAMHGDKFGGSMGLTTWAAFNGSDALAVMDGDFAMTAVEVQPVLKALRRGGINVVALHNHMVGEHPAYYFVHFWGKGEAAMLATAFKQAIDDQAKTTSDTKVSAAADAEQQVRDLERQFEAAILHGELAFFERVLAPEFTHTSQNGKHRNRDEWLANHKAGESPYDSLNTDGLSVRVYGPTAIVTGKIAPKGRSSSGAPIEGAYRFIHTWINHGGNWQVAAFQSTRIAPSEKGKSP